MLIADQPSSSQAVTGYRMAAANGRIGDIDGFLDPDGFLMDNSKVFVGLFRKGMESGPEYAESMPIAQEYEARLYLNLWPAAKLSTESRTPVGFALGAAY